MHMRKLVIRQVDVVILLILLTTISTAHSVGNPGTITVHVDQFGFSPSELEINQGDRIFFENIDNTTGHWPASDIHPTHGIYPEFDSKKPIPPGQVWTFNFDKAGIWRFHDHLFPDHTGTIAVKGNGNSSQNNSIKKSEGLKAKLTDMYKAIGTGILKIYFHFFPGQFEKKLKSLKVNELVKNQKELEFWLRVVGPKQIMAKLVSDSRGGSAFDCHQPAHLVGRTAYDIMGAQAFREGNANCHSGFYHGAMEALLIDKGTENVAATTDQVCSLFETNFSRFECLHGIGHGVMAYADYDLPLALKICGELNSQYSQSSCYGGVFMENIIAAEGLGGISGHGTKWVNTDPLFPCDAVSNSSSIQYECYIMQTSRMLDMYHHNFDRVAKECLNATAAYVSVCFKSFGRDAAGQTLRNITRIIQICNKVPKIKDYYNQCIIGALNVIVDFWGPSLKGQATELCNSINDIPTKSDCYKSLAERLSDLFSKPSERDAICQGFGAPYDSYCSRYSQIKN